LKVAPYATSHLVRVPEEDTVPAPTPDFYVGDIAWHVRTYATDPELEPFRAYYRANSRGASGLLAARRLSDSMAEQFPFGPQQDDFHSRAYDPVESLRVHSEGAPGHCIARAGLLSTTMLAAGIPARIVQFVPPRGKGHNVVEVWDEKHGWVLWDPLHGGRLEGSAGPVSAVTAARSPSDVKWVQVGVSAAPDDDPVRLYFRPSYGYLHGAVIYPEPWLYLRAGPREAPWPFRASFAYTGPQLWRIGPLQAFLRAGLVVSVLGFVCCLGVPLLTAVRRSRRPPNHRAVAADGVGGAAEPAALRCPTCRTHLSLDEAEDEFAPVDHSSCGR
jgi:hypothetical protein